jgi:hypothetical protein
MRSVLFAALATTVLAGTAAAQPQQGEPGYARPGYDQGYSDRDRYYRVPVDMEVARQLCAEAYGRAVEDQTTSDPEEVYVTRCVDDSIASGRRDSYDYNGRYGRFYYQGEPAWGESPWNDPYRTDWDMWR